MGTLHQFQQNNKATRVRGRSGKIEIADGVANPSKRKIVSSIFGRQSATELQAKQSQEIIDMNSRAIALYEKGEFNLASALFQEAAAIRNKVIAESGTNEADLACKTPPPTSSYIYQRIDFDEGMNTYETTQHIQLDDHPVALEATLFFNAGQAKRRLEDYAQAWHYYRLALCVLQPLQEGDSYPFRASLTATTGSTVHAIVIPVLHNMGQLAYRQGNVSQAVDLYEAALAHCQSLKGHEDHSVGVTFNCLGVLYYHLSAEESEKAKNYFSEALHILTASCGKDSKAVATTLNNLGRVLVQQENFDAALEQYERALEIRRQTLGDDDIDFAATAFNAGQSLHQKGVFDRALSLYRDFLRVALMKLPKDHRDIAVVLSAIAQILQEKKEYTEALELYLESLRVGRAALGSFHAEVAMLLNRLGNFYFEREHYCKALKAYKEGLDIERKVLESGSHPNIIVTLSNIAEIQRQKGRYPKAVRYYREALDLQKERYGASSAEVAGALNVIGLIHDQMGDAVRALKYLQEALVMRRTVLGDDHLEVGNTLTCLGTIFYRRSMVSTALMLFTESYRIRSSELGPDDRDSSFTLYNVGLCHQLTGNAKEAISCFKETLRVEKLVLGVNSRDISLTLFKLGEAYNADGDQDNALSCFREALEIEREVEMKEDPANVARTLNEIGNIHLARNEITEMMTAFTESARLFRSAGMSIHSVSVSPSLKLYAAGFTPAAASA